MPLGAERGTVAAAMLERRATNARLVLFDSAQKGASALKAERIDGFVGDAPVIWRIGVENEAGGLTPIPRLIDKEYLAWAVRRGNVVLRDSANAALVEWAKAGTLDAMIRRYMPRYKVLEKMQP